MINKYNKHSPLSGVWDSKRWHEIDIDKNDLLNLYLNAAFKEPYVQLNMHFHRNFSQWKYITVTLQVNSSHMYKEGYGGMNAVHPPLGNENILYNHFKNFVT